MEIKPFPHLIDEQVRPTVALLTKELAVNCSQSFHTTNPGNADSIQYVGQQKVSFVSTKIKNSTFD